LENDQRSAQINQDLYIFFDLIFPSIKVVPFAHYLLSDFKYIKLP